MAMSGKFMQFRYDWVDSLAGYGHLSTLTSIDVRVLEREKKTAYIRHTLCCVRWTWSMCWLSCICMHTIRIGAIAHIGYLDTSHYLFITYVFLWRVHIFAIASKMLCEAGKLLPAIFPYEGDKSNKALKSPNFWEIFYEFLFIEI